MECGIYVPQRHCVGLVLIGRFHVPVITEGAFARLHHSNANKATVTFLLRCASETLRGVLSQVLSCKHICRQFLLINEILKTRYVHMRI